MPLPHGKRSASWEAGYGVLRRPNVGTKSLFAPFCKGGWGDLRSDLPGSWTWHYAPSVGNELLENLSASMIAAGKPLPQKESG